MEFMATCLKNRETPHASGSDRNVKKNTVTVSDGWRISSRTLTKPTEKHIKTHQNQTVVFVPIYQGRTLRTSIYIYRLYIEIYVYISNKKVPSVNRQNTPASDFVIARVSEVRNINDLRSDQNPCYESCI